MSLFACLPPPDNFEDAQSVTPDAATQISGDANAAAADANDIDVNAEDAAIDVALTPDAGVATDASDLRADASAPIEEATPHIAIVEAMVSNTFSHPDEDGDFGAWIEIQNRENQNVTIENYSLTNDRNRPARFVLPTLTLSPNERVIVYMSAKDRSAPQIHANFSLIENEAQSPFVELRRASGAVASVLILSGALPDISIGWQNDAQGERRFLEVPTPGQQNSDGSSNAKALPPVFSVTRGLYRQAQNLELFARGGAAIHYTTDGSVPSSASPVYQQAIDVSQNQVVRAAALFEGEFSEIETHSFLFFDDILNAEVMSQEIVNDARYTHRLEAALTRWPTISITTPNVVNADETVAASVEMFGGIESVDEFQAGCGVRLVGGHSLRAYPKNSMRLYFKSIYGPSSLEYPLFDSHQTFSRFAAAKKFDQLHLRSGSHDSVFYVGSDFQPPANAQYIRNRFMQDTLFLMGQLSLRGRFVHVYLNGEYRGHYHLGERPTHSMMAEIYGGEKEDYAYTNKGTQDDVDIWEAAKSTLGNYEQAKRAFEIGSFIDYQLLNYFAGNDWDWLQNQNWMAAGPRVMRDDVKWNVFSWDADIIFIAEDANNTDPDSLSRTRNPLNAPDGVFTELRAHPDFVNAVSDRAYELLFNEGLLTPSKLVPRYLETSALVEESLIAESARWGAQSAPTWTVDDDFIVERDRIANSYLVNRTAIVTRQLRAEGLLSALSPPGVSVDGVSFTPGEERLIPLGASVEFSSESEVYYTLNGSDPRAAGGSIAPNALSGTHELTQNVDIFARSYNGNDFSPPMRVRLTLQ